MQTSIIHRFLATLTAVFALLTVVQITFLVIFMTHDNVYSSTHAANAYLTDPSVSYELTLGLYASDAILCWLVLLLFCTSKMRRGQNWIQWLCSVWKSFDADNNVKKLTYHSFYTKLHVSARCMLFTTATIVLTVTIANDSASFPQEKSIAVGMVACGLPMVLLLQIASLTTLFKTKNKNVFL